MTTVSVYSELQSIDYGDQDNNIEQKEIHNHCDQILALD
jgi:hypothetical protein